jgi:hypothetical protein
LPISTMVKIQVSLTFLFLNRFRRVMAHFLRLGKADHIFEIELPFSENFKVM